MMGAQIGQSNAVRQTEVSKALENLHSIISIGGKELDDLGSLLLRIRSAKPQKAQEACSPPEPQKCELANTIANCAGEIALMVEQIKLLQNEIEL